MKAISFLVICCALVALPASAQTTPPAPGPGFDVAFGQNSYSSQPCSAVLAANGGNKNGVGCAIDNGHPPGSFWNSGLFSMAVPNGGTTMVDLSQVRKPLLQPIQRGFFLGFKTMVPIFLFCTAMTVGCTFGFIWLSRLGQIQ